MSVLFTRRQALVSFAAAPLLFPSEQTGPHNDGRNASALALDDDPVLGNSAGDVTLLDFYDLRCPACIAMEPRILRLIAADNGLRYVPVDYPLFGAPSELGARAVLAAQLQGHYGALRVRLFGAHQRPSLTLIEELARDLKLDWARLRADMNGASVSARIKNNLARGNALGIKVLPMMFLGPIMVPGELHFVDLADLLLTARKRQSV